MKERLKRGVKCCYEQNRKEGSFLRQFGTQMLKNINFHFSRQFHPNSLAILIQASLNSVSNSAITFSIYLHQMADSSHFHGLMLKACIFHWTVPNPLKYKLTNCIQLPLFYRYKLHLMTENKHGFNLHRAILKLLLSPYSSCAETTSTLNERKVQLLYFHEEQTNFQANILVSHTKIYEFSKEKLLIFPK